MSSSHIQPKPLYEVGPLVAETMGLDWCRDRKEIVQIVNRFREFAYLMENMTMFDNKFYCLKIDCFPMDCTKSCRCNDKHYYGVTLPRDIDGLLEVWEDDDPMHIRSSRREGRVGRKSAADQPPLKATLLGQRFPTQRPMTGEDTLAFYTTSAEDEGKIVNVVALDCDGNRVELNFKLQGDGGVHSEERVVAIESVVLPNLSGNLIFQQGSGSELSEYSCYETVPNYRRVKLPASCKCDRNILIQGTQEFTPIAYDTDIVEIGSRLILEAYVKSYRYGDRGTESDEIQKSIFEESKVKRLIRSAMDRKRGRAYQDGSPYSGRKITASSKLPGVGYRGRCRPHGECLNRKHRR